VFGSGTKNDGGRRNLSRKGAERSSWHILQQIQTVRLYENKKQVFFDVLRRLNKNGMEKFATCASRTKKNTHLSSRTKSGLGV